VNFFSDYNQIELNESYYNLTEFIIPIRLLRIITLSQKIINSIIQFVKMITKILEDRIFKNVIVFFNNVNIKSPRTFYKKK
jgi:hypothetical protein